MNFEIKDTDGLARIGHMTANQKELVTPNLFPVVHPYNNLINASDLKEFGAHCLFTNAYITYKNPELRNTVLEKGIHKHLGYDGLIATDSGAFQQYMYNDEEMYIKPEIIEKFQEDIGSDFPVILDVPVQLNDDYEIAKEKVSITLRRASDNINRRSRKDCFWFGPIHGGNYKDLLKKSAIEMSQLDFGIFAIGGLVKAFLDYRFDLTLQILLSVKKYITPSKPLHMFGLGLPQFFALAVACGCDLMDSAAYVLFARENRYFNLSTGTKNLEELEEFPCHCPICSKHTPSEMKKFEERIRVEMLAKHNLYLSFSELRTIRQSIREGNLWELVEQRIRSHPNLVKAARVIKKNQPFFEIFEKNHKIHGRLFSSPESINRPLIYRYLEKIKHNYRVPQEAKYLIILPELDTKGYNSPSISQWLKTITVNQIIHRNLIHIVFLSPIYGIIPLELMNTFPMGQYESTLPIDINDPYFHNTLRNVQKYFKHHAKSYESCGLLIPETFVNQFGEIVTFSSKNLLDDLETILKPLYKSHLVVDHNLEKILKFFG